MHRREDARRQEEARRREEAREPEEARRRDETRLGLEDLAENGLPSVKSSPDRHILGGS